MERQRSNIKDLPINVLLGLRQSPRQASEALRNFFNPLGKPQELPVIKRPEVLKKHIKFSGKR